MTVLSGVQEGGERVTIGHVDGNTDRAGTNVTGGRLSGVTVEVANRDTRAGAREVLSDRPADPVGAPGHGNGRIDQRCGGHGSAQAMTYVVLAASGIR